MDNLIDKMDTSTSVHNSLSTYFKVQVTFVVFMLFVTEPMSAVITSTKVRQIITTARCLEEFGPLLFFPIQPPQQSQ